MPSSSRRRSLSPVPAPCKQHRGVVACLLLVLLLGATAAAFGLLQLLNPFNQSSSSGSSGTDPLIIGGGRGRRGGGAGAGTKRPYTPLDVVMEEAWVAHHVSHHDNLSSSSSSSSGGGGGTEEEEDEWELRYVTVLARHGARYPTKRKLTLAIKAAHTVRRLMESSSSSSLPPTSAAAVRAWSESTLAALEGAEGADLAPLGSVEHKLLGEEVARAYLTTTSTSSVSLRAHVTSKARTRQSCRAFREGAAALWPPAQAALACDEEAAESEGLLRPYAGCGRLDAHRAAVVEEEEKGSLEDGLMQRARAAVARGLGLSSPSAAAASEVDEALVMGLFYACQTDLTLLAPLHHYHGGDAAAHAAAMAAHAAWIEGSPQLGQGPGEGGGPEFSACALLPAGLLEAMEAREDRENYHTRGFGLPATREVMAPFLQHVTARMEAALAMASSEPIREVEVFFAHDTTLLPTVALLDLIRLEGLDAGRSGAARAVPYASRLVLEAWASSSKSSSKSSNGGGRIRVSYNGRVLATLEGGLGEWRAKYAAALAVRREEVCALEEDEAPASTKTTTTGGEL